jgi:hypothetical protein
MLGLRKMLVTGAVSVALVAGGTAAGAAIASGPVDSSGVIHGCWTNAAINGTHVFVLQDAGTNCPRGTTAISWNQTGPQGPAGPAGTVGAAGPAGPAGPIGNTGPAGQAGAPGPTGPAGPQGPIGNTGPPGPAGANGNTVLNGTGAPPASVGNDGDFYIDTAADVLYGPKANGSWPAAGVSLAGASGATGPQGPAGPQGPPGPAGAASSLDSLIGTPCDTGTPQVGTLRVTYTPQQDGTDTVSIVCIQTNPVYTLNVKITTSAAFPLGALQVISTTGTGAIDCLWQPGNVNQGTCSATVVQGSIVTLTESAATGTTTPAGWAGCDSVSSDGLTCIVRITSLITNVTASFS